MMHCLNDAPACFQDAAFCPVSVRDGQPGFEAAWLRVGKFPLEQELRGQYAHIFHALHARIEQINQQQFTYDVYLQMTQLERPFGPRLISKNASNWSPRIAMGVWPDRDPPQPLSQEDFFNTLPGEQMREATFQLRRIEDDTNTTSVEVVNAMAGTGALMIALAEKGAGSSYRDSIATHLEAHITAEEFRGYPAYFPLLDAVSLESMSRQDREACLGSVTLYLREDLLENAVLVVSKIPLKELFAGIYFN